MSRFRRSCWFAVAVLLASLPALPQPQSFSSDSPERTVASLPLDAVHPAPPSFSPPQPAELTPEQTGDLDYLRQRYQAAIEAYIKVEPPSAAVWNKMGIAYQMLFDTKDAARCYKQALKMDPQNTHALNNLATLEDSTMDFAHAEEHYRKALKIEPRSATIWKNLGTNLFMQHLYEKGAEAYSQALAIDPHVFDESPGPSISHPAPSQDRGATAYFKARTCARAGLDDCALANLRKAFDDGVATMEKVNRESDFAALRTTQNYAKLVANEQ